MTDQKRFFFFFVNKTAQITIDRIQSRPRSKSKKAELWLSIQSKYWIFKIVNNHIFYSKVFIFKIQKSFFFPGAIGSIIYCITFLIIQLHVNASRSLVSNFVNCVQLWLEKKKKILNIFLTFSITSLTMVINLTINLLLI